MTQREGGWQPIQTAPRDGTEIQIGAYFNDRFNQAVSKYIERGGKWLIVDGPDDYRVFAVPEPTHWMPLPAPPSTTDRSNE